MQLKDNNFPFIFYFIIFLSQFVKKTTKIVVESAKEFDRRGLYETFNFIYRIGFLSKKERRIIIIKVCLPQRVREHHAWLVPLTSKMYA